MLEKVRERKVAVAWAEWQAATSQYYDVVRVANAMVERGVADDVTPHGMLLQRGERFVHAVHSATLVESRRVPGLHVYGNDGVSQMVSGGPIPLFAARGAYVPGPDLPTSVDYGTGYVTTRRVLFHGRHATREWRFDALFGIVHAPDSAWTALPVTTRNQLDGLGYAGPVASWVRFYLEAAVAAHRGELAGLVEAMNREYRRMLTAEPPRPALGR
jgi:hypothetical protein